MDSSSAGVSAAVEGHSVMLWISTDLLVRINAENLESDFSNMDHVSFTGLFEKVVFFTGVIVHAIFVQPMNFVKSNDGHQAHQLNSFHRSSNVLVKSKKSSLTTEVLVAPVEDVVARRVTGARDKGTEQP